MERALSDLVGLATKLKVWFVVTSVGIPSSALGIWQSDNILAPFLGTKEQKILNLIVDGENDHAKEAFASFTWQLQCRGIPRFRILMVNPLFKNR